MKTMLALVASLLVLCVLSCQSPEKTKGNSAAFWVGEWRSVKLIVNDSAAAGLIGCRLIITEGPPGPPERLHFRARFLYQKADGRDIWDNDIMSVNLEKQEVWVGDFMGVRFAYEKLGKMLLAKMFALGSNFRKGQE